MLVTTHPEHHLGTTIVLLLGCQKSTEYMVDVIEKLGIDRQSVDHHVKGENEKKKQR